MAKDLDEVVELDDADAAILQLLLKDGSLPISEVSVRLNLNRQKVERKITKLTQLNILTGLKASVNIHNLGFNIQLIALIQTDPRIYVDEIVDSFKIFPEIYSIEHAIGKYNLIVYALCRNNAHVNSFIQKKLYRVEGIKDIYVNQITDKLLDREMRIIYDESEV